MDRQLSRWEGDSDEELSHWEKVIVRERYQQQVLRVQEIFHRGARRSQKLYLCQEEHVSSQELCQWRRDIRSKMWDRALRPLSEEEPQPCRQSPTEAEPTAAAQAMSAGKEELPEILTPEEDENINEEILIQGLTDIYKLLEKLEEEYALQQQLSVEEQTQPSSASAIGMEVAAEAAPALPCTSPVPGSPTEAKPAAAAPAAAHEKEELPKPLTPEEVKAAASSVFSEELPLPGTQSSSSVPSDTLTSSLASLCQDQDNTEEILIQGLTEMYQLMEKLEEEYALQQQMAVEESQPSSPSPVGAAVPAEAAPALPCPSPFPQSPTDQIINRETLSQVLQEMQALKQQVAALQQSLAVRESAVAPRREERSVPAPQSIPPAPQRAMEQNTNREVLSQVLHELQALKQQQNEVHALQQQLADKMESLVTAKREESSVPAPHSPPSPWPAQLGVHAPREQLEEAAVGSAAQAEVERMDDSDEEMKWWQFLDDLEPFLVREPELSQVSVTGHTMRFSLAEGIPELVPCGAPVEHPAQEPCSQGPVPAPQSPPSPQPAQLRAQAPRQQQQEGPASASVWAVQESEDGSLAGDNKECKDAIETELSQWEKKEDPEQEVSEEELSDWEESTDEDVSQGEECPEQEVSQEEFSDWDECTEEDVSQGEECPEQEVSQEEFSDWEERTEEDVSRGEVASHHEDGAWEEYFPEQGLSQGEVNSSRDLSDWEEYPGQGLIGGEIISCAEYSAREEYIGQDLSQREACIGQDITRENGSRLSGRSSAEDHSCEELVQENCEDESDHGIGTKASFFPEEEERDDMSILELHPEDQELNWRIFAADGLPVPIPHEAWVEEQEPQLHSPGPLRASLMPVKGQLPVGHGASLPFTKPEAGRESRVPAPHSPWPGQLGAQSCHGQLAPFRKRPSRFRRALRALQGLFLCPCLRPRPEE
ncbi:titin-like [Passer domesticus]|uniref:titin-like n=1 Tax=Passer domesticus TaxID=48849 RepID=UPI0030FE5D9B